VRVQDERGGVERARPLRKLVVGLTSRRRHQDADPKEQQNSDCRRERGLDESLITMPRREASR
jgi:hypothetical protein